MAEGLDMFKLGAVATGGRMIPSGNLRFTKRTLVEWLVDVREMNTEGLGSLWLMVSVTFFFGGGGVILAEGLHDWGRRAMPLLDFILAFALQLSKNTQNFSRGNRVVTHYSR
jgi:hypothetical protein